MPTSLGPAEILVILVVALIVLGPKRLPEAGRQVGKAIAEVRRWTTEVTTEIKSAVDIEVPAKSTVVKPVVVADTTTAVDTRPEMEPASAVVAPAAVAEAGPALVADHAEHEAMSSSEDESPNGPPTSESPSSGSPSSESPEPPPGDPARL
jgi:Tat protein translocase TatB subunit